MGNHYFSYLLMYCFCLSAHWQRLDASSYNEDLDSKAITRELARHEFFEKNLSESPTTETQSFHMPRKLTTALKVFSAIIASLLIAYTLSCLLRYIPYTQSKFASMEKIYTLAKKGKTLINECSLLKDYMLKESESFFSNQPIPQYDFDTFASNWEKKLREQENFFTLITSAIFSFLTPIMYAIINALWERPKSLNYQQILERYIAEWSDFKICTPRIFWERFDIFFLGYLVNNKTMLFNQEESEGIVKTMLLESLNKKFEYKN